MNDHTTITLRRSLDVPPERIWNLWTTPEGIGAWWAPDGFQTTVDVLELHPGGALDYTMTATGPEQVAFMEQAGMPLSTPSHKEFTEVVEPTRLAYTSRIDFVPGHDPTTTSPSSRSSGPRPGPTWSWSARRCTTRTGPTASLRAGPTSWTTSSA